MAKQKNGKIAVVQPSAFDDVDKLAARVFDLFQAAKRHKQEQRVMGKSVKKWLVQLSRAYHKIHEQEELDNRPNMTTYFGLIHTKTNMVQAFIKSKYVAFKAYPFALEPTPIVELPKDLQDKGFQIVVSKLLDVLVQQGLPAESMLAENGLIRPSVVQFVENQAKQAKSSLREEEMKIAKLAAQEMTTLIQDQFAHGNFEEAMTDFIGDLALYPAAFLSFDYVLKTDNKWQKNKFVKSQSIQTVFRSVSPKNAFPSPDFSGSDGRYFIELLQRSRGELAGFLGQPDLGYLDDAIKDVLQNGVCGWLENDSDNTTGDKWRHDDDVIDVLKCQINLSGADLLDYGVSLADLGGGSEDDVRYKYFNADVEVCSNRVICVRLVQAPHGKRTYFMTSYKRVNGSAWGVSPAMMIYDRQLSVNRTHYAMALNAFHSAGPMIEMQAGAFDNPNDVQFLPYSVAYSQAEKERAGGGLAFHQITPTFQMLFAQLTNEIRLADDECGLPSFLNGNAGLQGAGRTLGGLAIMQDNAVMGLKECFANIDMYVIRPIVEMLRDTNLEDGKDMGIRGDCDVKATGLIGLNEELEKARAMAGLMPSVGQFAQQGAIPQQMYTDYVLEFLKSNGMDVSKYAPMPNVSGELGNMIASDVPSQTAKLDNRSLH